MSTDLTMNTIPIGVTADGEIVSQDLGLSPHMVIYGATMSGKTVALRASAQERLARGHDVVSIGYDFVNGRPHARSNPEQILRDVINMVERRRRTVLREGAASWAALPEAVRDSEGISPVSVSILVDGFHPQVDELRELLAATSLHLGVYLLVSTPHLSPSTTRYASDTVIQFSSPGSTPSDAALTRAFGPNSLEAKAAFRSIDDGQPAGLAVVSTAGSAPLGVRIPDGPDLLL